jgi:hypothetical protein
MSRMNGGCLCDAITYGCDAEPVTSGPLVTYPSCTRRTIVEQAACPASIFLRLDISILAAKSIE